MLIRRIRSGIQAYLEDARTAMRVAPVEVGLAVITASTLSYALASDTIAGWIRIAAAAAIAFPLVFTTSALAAAESLSPMRRWMITGGVLLGAAAYAVYLFDPRSPAEVWRGAMLAAAALVVPTLTPAWTRADSTPRREWFWLFNLRLGLRAFTVYGFATTLMVGLMLAAGAIGGLFDVRIPSDTFAHIMGALLIGFGPWALVGGMRGLVREGVPPGEALIYARRVGLYLLLPLLAVYIGILYAYAVRIVFVTELPHNLVSPLVLSAGVLWLLATLVLEPFHWLPRLPGVARILRVVPILILPLVMLGGWAVALRIQQHGWTEFRYFRMVALLDLAILAAVGLVRFTRRQAPPLYSIPLVVMTLLVPAVAGPLGAPAVTKQSQRARLAAALRDAGFATLPAELGPEERATSKAVPADIYHRIVAGTEYLVQHFGSGALDGLIAGDVAGLNRAGDAAVRLGLSPAADGSERLSIQATAAAVGGVPVDAPAVLYGITTGFTEDSTGISAVVGDFTLTLDSNGSRLVVTRAGASPVSAPLGPLIESIELKAEPTEARRASPERVGPEGVRMLYLQAEFSASDGVLDLLDGDGEPRGQLIVRGINLVRGPDPFRREPQVPSANENAWTIEHLNALIVLRGDPVR